MSLATLRTSTGELDILTASLALSLAGVPIYHVEIDADEAPSGRVEIAFGTGPVFVGSVARSSAFEGRASVVIVGGSGGLSLEPELRQRVTGAGYTGTPLVVQAALVVGEIVGLAGEELSPLAEVALASLSLTRWQRAADYAGRAIGDLARALGVGWRVLPSGLVWFGAETWETYADGANIETQGQVSDVSELEAALVVDRPDIYPGMTLFGRRIERVVYALAGDALRARLTYQDSTAGGTLADALNASRGPAASVFAASHIARVVEQRADGTLDLMPDNVDVGGLTGINRVPLRVGMATARLRVEPGNTVILRFASSQSFPLGDPRLPYCEGLPSDITADRGVARMSDEVRIGSFSYVSGVGPPSVAITFTSIDGASSITMVLLGSVTAATIPPIVPHSLDGEIITASSEVFLG